MIGAEKTASIDLRTVVEYYEANIKPYKYVYHCEHGLTLEFDIKEDQLCHLLFGTINKSIPHRKNFIGQTGYNAIKSGNVQIKNLPYPNQSKAKNRVKYFFHLDKLLSKPNIIHYNKQIVRKGNSVKVGESAIDASYLFTKQFTDDVKKVHFFLKTIKQKIEPITFFAQEDTSYIENQLTLKVIDIEKLKK